MLNVKWLSDFYSDIYMSAVNMGITDLDTLKKEGFPVMQGRQNASRCTMVCI